MTETARALNADETVELIHSHIAAYLDDGPNRKVEDIELGQRAGLKSEMISALWDDAEKQVVSLPPNKTYFAPLFEEINNGGAAAMLHDLLRIDLDGWHPRENVPQTKTLLEQKQLGLTGLEQWWCHLISVGELPRPDKKNPRYTISEYLLEDAKNQNPRNKFLTADELGRFLRDMGCTHKSNGKKWGWIFPPLPEARDGWRAHSGSEWEWLAPEIEEWGEKPKLNET
jgi:hypothetical protein